MPRRRFGRGRKKGYRKSYFAHLFEVDKSSCSIATLFGCPIAVVEFKLYPRLEGDTSSGNDFITVLTYETIDDYLNKAVYNYKNGNGMFNFNYVDKVGTSRFVKDFEFSDIVHFFLYLYRYWVPAVKHYYAFIRGASELPGGAPDSLSDIVHRIELTAQVINAGRSDEQEAVIGDLENLYGTIWSLMDIMVSPSATAIFYPVHKLIGKKVGAILRRCGVDYLIYPYANEPYVSMALKAGNYSDVYGTGTLPNVGSSGMSKFASTASSLDVPVMGFRNFTGRIGFPNAANFARDGNPIMQYAPGGPLPLNEMRYHADQNV